MNWQAETKGAQPVLASGFTTAQGPPAASGRSGAVAGMALATRSASGLPRHLHQTTCRRGSGGHVQTGGHGGPQGSVSVRYFNRPANQKTPSDSWAYEPCGTILAAHIIRWCRVRIPGGPPPREAHGRPRLQSARVSNGAAFGWPLGASGRSWCRSQACKSRPATRPHPLASSALMPDDARDSLSPPHRLLYPAWTQRSPSRRSSCHPNRKRASVDDPVQWAPGWCFTHGP